MTAEAKKLIDQIRALPAQERLRLVEQIVHDLAQPESSATSSMIGFLADEPELADAVEKSAMEARERDPLRRGGA